MSIDLGKLTPAPWYEDGLLFIGVDGNGNGRGWFDMQQYDGDDCPQYSEEEVVANTKFIALARNAFDVMMRRGWYACRDGFDDETFVGWIVCSRPTGKGRPFSVPNVMARHGGPIKSHTDPFTALVEADKWYRENVEKGAAS